jgi:hypothetical protein
MNNTASELATRYVDLALLYRDEQERMKKLKEELDAVEADVAATFAAEGIQNIRTSRGMAYLRRDLWASLTGQPTALCGTAFSWLVEPRVNAQSLSAAVRELPRDEADMPILPQEVKDAIKVSEVYRVGVRRN